MFFLLKSVPLQIRLDYELVSLDSDGLQGQKLIDFLSGRGFNEGVSFPFLERIADFKRAPAEWTEEFLKYRASELFLVHMPYQKGDVTVTFLLCFFHRGPIFVDSVTFS